MPIEWASGASGDSDLDAGPVNFHGEKLAASVGNSFLNADPGVRFDQHYYATAAARAANFSRQRAFPARALDDAIDCFRGNCRQIAFAKIPFFAHQAAGFFPIGFLECDAHGLRHFRDALEIGANLLLAVDVRLEYFPVVDARLPRLAGVAKYEAPFEFASVEAQFNTAFATGRKFDSSGAAECRRIVVLRSGGNFDDDPFRVAADVDPIHFALPGRGKTVQRGTNGDGHCARAAYAGSSRRLGIGSQREAALRFEELGDLGEQRQMVPFRFYHSREGCEIFLSLGVAGNQANAFVARCVRLNNAARITRNRGVNGYCSRMKEVERPDIQSSAGQVYTSGRLRFDAHILFSVATRFVLRGFLETCTRRTPSSFLMSHSL